MIDLNELEHALAAMKPRQRLYEIVKIEMQRRGRWKAKGRGKSFRRGYDSRRNGINQ